MSKALLVVVASISGALLLTASTGGKAPCRTGEIQGYALITDSRIGGVGAIPSRFTTAQRYFGRRYNCTQRLIAVRRLDEGLYEVRFPGNRAVVISASAFNADGTASSAVARGAGSYLVRLLGPRIDSNVLEPRDTSFVIVLF